ncbi:MAG: EamA family transporter [Candidatus Nanopelagicales bacterium]|nr:EamA family transporter [Candidatus Nanopelagicales bacterium]MDE1046327.1 EamA family transporter [Candidatus Nanopelagicales bacterium]
MTADVRGVTEAPFRTIMGPLITLWIVWGSTYTGIALMVKSMPPLIGSGTRFIAASLVLGIIVLLVKGPRAFTVTWPQVRGAVFMGVTILGVAIGIVSLAVRYVPTGIAALIVSVLPLWIILFRLRAGDRPSRLTLIGVGVGLIGLFLILIPGGTVPISGASNTQVALWSVAIACGSFCWAFFSWRSTSYQQPKNPLTTAVIQLATAGIFLTLVGALIGERWNFGIITQQSWAGWVFLVFASTIAYGAFVWLINNAPMSLVTTHAYVNPMVAVTLGFLILKEPISLDVVVGLSIVVGGVALVVSGERRTRQLLAEQPQ